MVISPKIRLKCSQLSYRLFDPLLVECYKCFQQEESDLKNLRRQFDIFCYKNRSKGIPNLMLYIVLGTAIVYIMSNMAGNTVLYYLLRFDRTAILQGTCRCENGIQKRIARTGFGYA